MHTQIANKLETDVKLQLYIDPIKLLHIHNNNLLFLVLYKFVVYIIHELDYCKFVVKKYCNKILLYSIRNLEDISDSVWYIQSSIFFSFHFY